MTKEENIATLIEHLDHWKRLLSEKICDQDEGEKTIDALQNAIKALEQEPCDDAISRQAVLEAIDVKAWEFCDYLISNGRNDEQKPVSHFADNLRECVGDLPSVTPQQNKWIPVKWHEITDEEREREGYTKDWITIFDCVMPEDEQEILITVKDRKGRLWVEKDTCYIDDGFYLDSGYDWIEDVVAWSELPEPYKAESEE